MPRLANIESVILESAEHIAQEMARIARESQSEEDVRHECNKLIDGFLDQAGIQVRGKHEYGLAGGRIDSKYGAVIIEYKFPKGPGRVTPDRNAPGTRALIEQIKERFRDFQMEERLEPDRIFGVGCDSRYMIFVRNRGGKFEDSDPQAVGPYSVERLLRALVSLGSAGHAYTPENLARDFGAESPLALKGISEIYQSIEQTPDLKAQVFFQQWKILFGEVCGYDLEGKNERIRKLGQHYHLFEARPAALLFSIHTYYAILLKLLAAEIASTISPMGVSILKRFLAAPTAEKLRREMESLEQGGIWSQLKITNFLEGDLFAWYLPAWNESLAEAVKNLLSMLDQYDSTTLSVDPEESRDLLKQLYQHLFPKAVRHDLGEYYTPDWLAELVLDEVGYDGNPNQRLLDPACGSGTFLVMAINRAKTWFSENRYECGFGESELIQKILANIIGFDLNPLAVMAARTNYLLAVRGLIQNFASEVELPVYLCDSIMTPAEHGVEPNGQTNFLSPDGMTAILPGQSLRLHIAPLKSPLLIPYEIARDRVQVGKYTETLETSIRNHFSPDEFISRCREEALPLKEVGLHLELYSKLRKLDENKLNGIWARIIKNAFAPLFVGRVDFVIGNPPWVNWESLPSGYREAVRPLYQEYGLFELKNSGARLGAVKKDLSMLFVYGGADYYLRAGGRIGYVITQTLFKTIAGSGFRNFQYTRDHRTTVIKPVVVHDLSGIQVFEGATNRAAILIAEKRKRAFSYPVPYWLWQGPSRIHPPTSLKQVERIAPRIKLGAAPIQPQNRTSPWLTAPKKALKGLRKIIGPSEYKAFAGSCTWLNGIYWAKRLKALGDGKVLIENLGRVGKIKFTPIQYSIEPDYLYPLIRGRDVLRWQAVPSAFIIFAQDPTARKGISERNLKIKHPKTYSYFFSFEKELRKRSGFKQYFKPSDPFYSIGNISPAILAKWKVMWPEVGNTIRAGVCGPIRMEKSKPVLPDHTLVAVGCEKKEEAHYLCALLNSSPARCTVASYITLHPSPHVLENISLPRFEAKKKLHQTLAQLSMSCHAAAARGDREAVLALEAEIDRAAAKLWGITDEELRAIKDALQELKLSDSPPLPKGNPGPELEADDDPELESDEPFE